MPVIRSTSYQPPKVLINGHLQTIYPALLRRVKQPNYQRERLPTPDNDFVDLDWVIQENDQLVIVCHGLEGNSTRPYVKGMVQAFTHAGFDVLACNYRGCSEEMNQHPHSYHSGATEDIELIVNHAVSKGYQKISLVGFSLGGNLVLKYLGESATNTAGQVISAVAFSVPLDLLDCAIQIHRPSNFLYEQRFLRSFFRKAKDKAKRFKEINLEEVLSARSVYEFDEVFTAPISGYQSAIDYYAKCSSIKFIKGIKVPTLVVNALNDPFLGSRCFETVEFEKHDHVTFELLERGGHCGFASFNSNFYWSESRAVEFIQTS